MQAGNITEAAQHILKAWREGGHFDSLPAHCAPASVEEGYAIQQRFAEHLGTAQTGWKIAATSNGGQRHIGVDHPLIGRLFADRVYDSPATLMLRDNRMLVAEAEFVFRFGRTPDPAAGVWTRDSVMDHVDALFTAIELPDSRFKDFIAAGAAGLVADNACGREFVLGEEVAGRWRDIALERFPVRIYVNENEVANGTGGDVLGDPRDALTWFVNACRERGQALEKGQIVTTGVVGKPVTISPGDHVRADFGVLGSVEVTFSQTSELI